MRGSYRSAGHHPHALATHRVQVPQVQVDRGLRRGSGRASGWNRRHDLTRVRSRMVRRAPPVRGCRVMTRRRATWVLSPVSTMRKA